VIVVIGIFLQVFFQTHKVIFLKGLLLLFLTVLSSSSVALNTINVDITSVKSSEFNLKNLSVKLASIRENESSLLINTQQTKLTANRDFGVFNRFIFNCEKLMMNDATIQCDKAIVNFNNQLIKANNSKTSFTFNQKTSDLDLKMENLSLLNGEVSSKLSMNSGKIKGSIKLRNLKIDNSSIEQFSTNKLDALEISSLVSGKASFIHQDGVLNTQFTMLSENTAFSDELGENLGDDITLSLSGRSVFKNNNIMIESLDAGFMKGELLTPFLYANFNQRAAKLKLKKVLIEPSKSVWKLKNILFDDEFIHLSGSDFIGSFSSLDNAEINIKNASLENVYINYLQPVLSHELSQMDINGIANAHFTIDNKQLSDYEISLSSVNAEHTPEVGKSKYLILNMNARIDSSSADSYLNFSDANFLDVLSFGETNFPLKVGMNSIKLTEPTPLPVFDGNLLIREFSIDKANESLSVNFKGVLSPVSLSLLTQALDWPLMDGMISGVIPSVTYNDGNVKLDGALQINAFDGNISVRNVEASHLLSSWPVLNADIKLTGINLERLTNTFEFGRITGLMDGSIDQLILENWEPTQFNAIFETSDKSKTKRISQKAVDNISNLGGVGVAGALSRTFMRFFDDFGYDKIGISCKLKNSICEMDGVEPANQGYYLVKGGGIPRIDIIGFNRSTNWDILLDRLIHISDAGTPDIQ